LFISETGSHRVRRIRAVDGVVDGSDQIITIAGNGVSGSCDGLPATGACLTKPLGLAVSGVDTLYIGQQNAGGDPGGVVRVTGVSAAVPSPTMFAAADAGIDVGGIAVNDVGDLYIARPAASRIAWVPAGGNGFIDPADVPVVVAGTGIDAPGVTAPADLAVATAADLNRPVWVEVDALDGHVFFTNQDSHTIHVIDTGANGVVDGGAGEVLFRIGGGASPTPGFCGDSSPPALPINARNACLNGPLGIAYDSTKGIFYLADQQNDRVRKIPSDSDGDGLLDLDEDANANGQYDALSETDAENTDTDGDGCADSEELASTVSLGGDRNPKVDGAGQWDFFDVPTPALSPSAMTGTRNRAVSLSDVGAVLFYVGTVNGGGPNANGVAYDDDRNFGGAGNGIDDGEEYDRQPSNTPGKPWRSRAPNGAVSLSDVGVALAQVGHNCTPAP
jgi:hypothetical protein